MEAIEYDCADGISTITIHRQHRMNALNPNAMQSLKQAFHRFERSEESRVCILTGEGAKAFCAGADIHETQDAGDNFAKNFFSRQTSTDRTLYIRDISLPRLGLTKPVIAAINGVAVGGGMELALNCDIAIAAETARMGLPEVCIGSIPAVGGIQRIIHALPRALAMKLLMTGELIDASQALEWGLVAEVVAPDELMPRARAIARQIAANAPLAVKAVRYLAEKAYTQSLNEALETEELVWGHIAASKDRREGRAAFSERRNPVFTGL
ncbi:enoyl-CoA hydratase/isomerase family protein [Alcaligenaceae bacterium]|nr:enoyl-CoA hydratase/isomerase family protein [Alcaligenaceae bacterium]